MSEQPADWQDEDAVEEPLLAWVDRVADAEGLTREEAVDYLVSSYWQLQEVAELLQEPDAPGQQGPRSGERAAENPPNRIFDPVPEAGAGSAGSPMLDSDLDELKATVDDALERLTELEDVVDDMASEDQRVEPALGPDIEELDDRISEVEDRVTTIGRALDTLDQQTTALREESASMAAVDELEALMSALREESRSRHEGLKDRVTTELGHIRTILEHLLETRADAVDRTEGRTTDVQQRIEALLTDRERMVRIARTADREGLGSADCDDCGHTVDLGLLETARCPHCDATFTDLESTGGVFGWFRSATLRVGRPGSG